ncbi:MAG: hypothetical protein RLY20_2389 [Verrucomicrobiota bacterium]|jgi:hypothetical protein
MVATMNTSESAAKNRLPLWLKLAYTAFMAVLVPVYLINYGPTNFLYFCDVALLVTLVAVWRENALLASMAAVGILLPQFFWCLDFAANAVGFKLSGMTDYMFDPTRSLFLRGLSLFHGWLPFLLVFLVARLGYDRRAIALWSLVGAALILTCFFLMPGPGAKLANPHAPVNINYVRGLGETAAQTWMPEWAWLALMLIGMPLLIFTPTHFALRKFCPRAC